MLACHLGGNEHAFHIQVVDLVEQFFCVLLEGGTFGNAGIVYQNVDFSVFFCNGLESFSYCFQAGKVGGNALYLAARVGFPQAFCSFFCIGRGTGGDDDGGAFPEESLRSGVADATATTGDDRNFIF